MNSKHRLPRAGTRFLVLAWVLLLGIQGRAGAESYPVVFVHGYCADAEGTWGAMFPSLQRGLFGEEVIRLYQASSGEVLARDLPRSPQPLSFAIDFYNPAVGGSEGFSASAIAQVPIQRKASELQAVVDRVKRATGTSKVIVVAHDLGGLVARAYIEGIAQDRSGARVSYGDDVASLITIGTPSQGAPAAKFATAFPGCASGNPVNKAEMLPGSSFLTELNNIDWDSDIGTPVHAVVSYNQGQDGDGLVSRDSQDMTRIRRYERSAFIAATELQFDARMERLHAMVVNEPTVIALVQSEVEKAGRAQGPSPRAVTCGAGATAIQAGASVTGTLTDSDCTAPHRSGAKADLFSFAGRSGQSVTLTMTSSAFDTYLVLVGPSGSQVDANDDYDGGVNSRIQTTLTSSGTYTIEATAFSDAGRGAYTLTFASSGGSSCTTASLSSGETRSGTLADTDCTAPHRSGTKADLYTFTGSSGGVVTIAMSSSAFDTYLVLVGPNGSVVTENDDSDGGVNSRIQTTLTSAGTYTIEATSFSGDARGAYTLTLNGGTSCATSSLSSGETKSGTLADNDCAAPHRSGSRADLYTFTGSNGGTVTLSMTSSAFDTYLVLVGPGGRVVTENDDSDGVNARIATTLTSSGTYTVEATSFSGDARGAYTLSLNGGTSSCTTTGIALGQTVSGTLADGDCAAPNRAGSRADLHSFTGSIGQSVTIAMTASFDTYLVLVGPSGSVVGENDDYEGLNSRIQVTLPSSGTYRIEATSFSGDGRGSYTLSLSGSNTSSCSATGISSGQTVSGTLADSDCAAPNRSGSRADLYTFAGSSGQTVTIAMTASFDTYLVLVGPSGSVVGENDDYEGLNSRIQVTLPSSGTYSIQATSFSGDARGTYTLSLSGSSATSCTTTSISTGQTVSGELAETDCAAPRRSGAKADLFTFTGSSGQGVMLTMTSSAFDTYLFLVGPSGTVVGENDDYEGLNSRIQMTLPSAGTYTIEATSFSTSARGAYTLALSRVTGTSEIGALSMEVSPAKKAAMAKQTAKRTAIKTQAAKQAVVKQSEENVK